MFALQVCLLGCVVAWYHSLPKSNEEWIACTEWAALAGCDDKVSAHSLVRVNLLACAEYYTLCEAVST